jgi:hypothetical protein
MLPLTGIGIATAPVILPLASRRLAFAANRPRQGTILNEARRGLILNPSRRGTIVELSE